MQRKANRTLTMGSSGQYIIDEGIDAMRRMNRTELLRNAWKNNKDITNLKSQLENG